MTTYTVRLQDDTVGTINSDANIDSLIGNSVKVCLHDENGMPIEVQGIIAEILE